MRQLGEFVPAAFTVPQNPILVGTGNALDKDLVKGCMNGLPCRASINGLGDFEVPYVGVSLPGDQWMYLIGIGLIGGIYFMSRGSK